MALPIDFETGPPAAPIGPRNYSGWVALVLLFALLAFVAISSSFDSTSSASPTAKTQAASLERVVTHAPSRPASVSLLTIRTALEKTRLKSDEAMGVYALATVEARLPLAPADIARLLKSKDSNFLILGKVVETPKENVGRLRKLAAEVTGDSFTDRLIRAEALDRAGDPSARNSIVNPPAPNRSTMALFGLAMSFVIFAAPLVAWYYYEQRKKGLLVPLGVTYTPVSMELADCLAIRAAQQLGIFLGASIVVPLVIHLLLPSHSSARTMLDLAMPEAALLVGVFWLMKVPIEGHRFDLLGYGIRADLVSGSLKWALGGILVATPIILIVAAVILTATRGIVAPAEHPLSLLLQDHANIGLALVALFLASVAAPIFEEILFRGTLLPALIGVFSKPGTPSPRALPWGILVSSLVFASGHPQGIALWPVLATIGVTACLLNYQTRSVLPGMIFHATWNGVLVVLALTTG